MAKGINVKHNLASVNSYCQLRDYEKNIFDFYLLYWAWDDLDYGNEVQSYWPDAVKENIESIVISTADKWVKENQKYYKQSIQADT